LLRFQNLQLRGIIEIMADNSKTYSAPSETAVDGAPLVPLVDDENERLYELMGRIVDTDGRVASHVEDIFKLLTASNFSSSNGSKIRTRLRDVFFQTKISRLQLEIPKYLLRCKLKTGRNASEDNIRALKQLCVGLELIKLPEKDKRKRKTVYDSDAMVRGTQNS
jgi:hypothetical protein